MKYILILLLLICSVASAEKIDDLKLVDAIFIAEGGYKATYLYGIRSIPYKDESDARQICLNTVRNQRKRHAKHTCGLTYLECLANRYCPVGAKNDPKGLNRHWLKNVLYYYNKGSK